MSKADARGVIRNLREAIKSYDDLAGRRVTGNLDAALTAILFLTKSAARQVALYRDHLRALFARMKEITEAQARNPPSAAGPTIELPSRRPSASAHPVGMVDSDFDVFHPFRGN